MKYSILLLSTTLLSGCGALSTRDYQHYVESTKAISKDNTVAQTACWNAVTEIAKGGDNAARVGAIALADRCKNETVRVDAPRKSFLNF